MFLHCHLVKSFIHNFSFGHSWTCLTLSKFKTFRSHSQVSSEDKSRVRFWIRCLLFCEKLSWNPFNFWLMFSPFQSEMFLIWSNYLSISCFFHLISVRISFFLWSLCFSCHLFQILYLNFGTMYLNYGMSIYFTFSNSYFYLFCLQGDIFTRSTRWKSVRVFWW